LKNETKIEKKKFSQPIFLIYTEKYDNSAVMNDAVNTIWSQIIQDDSSTWKDIASNVKVTRINNAGHDFPMVFFEEANNQIRSWISNL